MRPYKQMHARMEVYKVLFMGGFEVQNFRGHDGGKYPCLFAGRRKSSIVGDCF